jgi:hypothetical protein
MQATIKNPTQLEQGHKEPKRYIFAYLKPTQVVFELNRRIERLIGIPITFS